MLISMHAKSLHTVLLLAADIKLGRFNHHQAYLMETLVRRASIPISGALLLIKVLDAAPIQSDVTVPTAKYAPAPSFVDSASGSTTDLGEATPMMNEKGKGKESGREVSIPETSSGINVFQDSLSNDEPRRLRCLIEGDSVIFTVTVPHGFEVGDLKKLIKKERELDLLKDVGPHTLGLWKVSSNIEVNVS
jgi:hypothetical protein